MKRPGLTWGWYSSLCTANSWMPFALHLAIAVANKAGSQLSVQLVMRKATSATIVPVVPRNFRRVTSDTMVDLFRWAACRRALILLAHRVLPH